METNVHDPRIAPSIGDIVTRSIRPRWWVRGMSTIAHALWKSNLKTASWAIADLCLWLQKKTRA